MRNCNVPAAGPLEKLEFPFQLRSFHTTLTEIDPTVVEELFRCSSGTLESLTLQQQLDLDGPTKRGLYASFPHVAAGIRTLSITNDYYLIVPRLAACTSLSRLILTSEVNPGFATAIFRVLPAPLEDLHSEKRRTVWKGPSGLDVLWSIIDALDNPCLSRLKRLHLPPDMVGSSLDVSREGGESIRSTLKSRNIAVIVVS